MQKQHGHSVAPHAAGTEINLDEPIHPGSFPGLNLGLLFKYGPILAEIVQTFESALAGGVTTVPVLKFSVGGKHVVYGPSPLQVTP